MKIKTVRGALNAMQRKVVASAGEKVTSSAGLDDTYGLLATEKDGTSCVF